MTITAVDLFCGSGGLSAGFIDSGIDVVAAFDDWETAVETYRRNISDHAFVSDLADTDQAVDAIRQIRPYVIAGGPPCQDFSSAGKRIEGGRANLTHAFGKIVAACKPHYFLMENVPRVRLSHVYKETKSMMTSVGYEVSEIILDASHCGVPQSRKRFFAFGSIRKKTAATRFVNSLENRINGHQMTVKDYLGDAIDIEYYYRHPRNYSRRSVFSVHEPSPTIRGVNRPVPPGYKGNHLDSAPPSTVRPLTSFERSRIQTFPESWDWMTRNRSANTELQIGNAVPVNLAAFVGAGIIEAAKSR